MINKLIKILIIPILVLTTVIIIGKVEESMAKDMPKATTYADLNNIDELVDEMFKRIEKENLFEQAYLTNSTKVSDEDIKILGNIIYNEVRGSSKLDQSCVAWTVLNRCDRDNKSIKEVASKPKQFAYKPNMKLKSKKAKAILAECEAMAKDVLIRHLCEQDGIEEVGRTLPNNYYSFWGDGVNTHFRTDVGVYVYWDYSLGNPYNGGF